MSLAPRAIFPPTEGQDAARFLNQLDLNMIKSIPEVRMAQKSSWFNNCVVLVGFRGSVPLLRGDYSGEERGDLGGLPCSCLAASSALTLSISLLLFFVTAALGLGGRGRSRLRAARMSYTCIMTSISSITINMRR
jgi:hypothetical protein